MKIRHIGLVSVFAITGAAGVGNPALAAEAAGAAAGAASAAGGVALEEVTVTARKRAQAEILQQAPITATVVTGKELVAAAAVNIIDVGKMSPGVSFQRGSTATSANFSIRGVGVSGTSPSDAPAVGIFQDGVYWGFNIGSLGEMFDVSHVDILRGPQGTLFGRNVTGGAVVIESNRPTYTPSVTLLAGYGSGNTMEGQVILNGPLVEDKVAGRLAISGRRSDGQFKWGGPGGGRYGREDMLLIRPSVVINPTDKLEVTLRGEYFTENGDPPAAKGIAPTRFINGQPQVITVSEQKGYVMPSDWTTIVNIDPRGSTQTTTGMLSAEARYKMPMGELIYIAGYRRVDFQHLTQLSGTPIPTFISNGTNKQSQYSNELRYAVDFGTRANLTAGIFQFHQQFSTASRTVVYSPALNGYGPQQFTVSGLDGEDAYGVYLEGDYNFTDQFTLTLGGRYSTDKKEAHTAPAAICNGPALTCPAVPVVSVKNTKFTPKVGLKYQFTPANMIYASYTEGVRDGGYALSGVPLVTPYNPEVVDAFEIGSKNDFFDHRLRVNVAIYDQKYKDMQKTVFETLPPPLVSRRNTQNAARADIKGVEVSTNWQINSDWRLDANYGYIHARYKELTPGFITAVNYRDAAGALIPASTLVGILRFNRVPEHTGNVVLNYNHTLDGGGQLTARASASFQSSYYFDDRNSMLQKGITLVDASAGYTFPGGETTVSVWGRNLGNQEHYEWGTNGGATTVVYFPALPRTWGVRISRTFQ